MKLVKQEFMKPLQIENDKINFLCIENKQAFYGFISDLYDLSTGKQNDIILSDNDSPVKFSNYADLLMNFIPFELNNKKLLTKLYDKLSKEAVDANMLSETHSFEIVFQSYVLKLCEQFDFELEFDNDFDVKGLLKAINLRFLDEYSTLSEKIFEYMINMRELCGIKVFIFVGVCSLISDEEFNLFIDTVINHRIPLLIIENIDCLYGTKINKRIIDEDFCEI